MYQLINPHDIVFCKKGKMLLLIKYVILYLLPLTKNVIKPTLNTKNIRINILIIVTL